MRRHPVQRKSSQTLQPTLEEMEQFAKNLEERHYVRRKYVGAEADFAEVHRSKTN